MIGKLKTIALAAALLATGLVPSGRTQTSNAKLKPNIAIRSFPKSEIVEYAGPMEGFDQFSQSPLPHETDRVAQKSGKPLAIPVGSLSSITTLRSRSVSDRRQVGRQWPMPLPCHGCLPSVSPDGRRIAFLSNRDYHWSIFTIDPEGVGERELIQPGPRIDQLAWVGSKVLYSVLRDNDKTVLREIDKEGTAPHDLAILTGRGAALSPDRHRLAYAAGKIWPTTLYKITVSDLKGKRARILSDVRFNTLDPAWSPDGDHVAFVQVDELRQAQIWVADSKGTDRRQLTHFTSSEGSAQSPSWSPDGRQLAFQLGQYGPQVSAHIYVLDVATGNAREVTPHAQPYVDESPSWFPDGKHIAFSSSRTGKEEVWVMNADGSEQWQVTGAQPPPAAPPSVFGRNPRVSPDGSPGPCGGHQLVYDDKLKMVVMVNCGETPQGLKGKLWGWNGSRWAVVSSNAPPTRVLGGAAYDSRRNMLVLYGGFGVVEGRPTPTSETWEWDGSRWTKRDVAPPEVTDHFAMTFDGARAKVVLHGGQGPDGVGKGDTWIWDGKKWEKASNTGPGPEAHHSLAYDSAKKKVLLFGGHQPQDFWEWDGITWKDWQNDKPRARSHACLAYDEKADQLVLFGGLGLRVWLGETWILKGSGWAAHKGSGPSPRGLCGMAYDRARGVVVMYGGSQTPFVDNAAEQYSDETWEWDSNQWIRK